MKQSQESASESETKGYRSLRFIEKGSIIQLKLLQRIPQVTVLRSISRVQSTVNHRIYLLISRKCLCTWSLFIRNCITYTCISQILDTCSDITYHTCSQFLTRNKLSCAKVSYFYNFCGKSGGHHLDLGSFFHTAVHNTAEYDNTFVCIINGVKDQRLQRCVHISVRCRDPCHDLLQDFFYIQSCFRRNPGGIVCLQSDHIFDLIYHSVRLCTWQVDLIDNRKYIQVMIQCQINIGKCLRLDSLSCINYQDRAVTGSQTSGYLIVKVYVAGGINEIENIFFPVLRFIYNTHCLRLDGNTTLSLKLHVIQDL